MAKIDQHIKAEITSLRREDLEKLVIKAAVMNKQFHDYLLVNFIDKKGGENELFEQAKKDLNFISMKSHKGFSRELQLANMLAACNKRINDFSKICKNKSLEMDLIFIVLEIPFSLSTKTFETCFTQYNYRVYLLVKKAIGILKTKLHEDYHIEYAPKLNEYLDILHKHSSYLDYVYDMPKSI